MSNPNFNIAKAITLLSKVISEAAEEEETVAASEYAERCNESEDFYNDVTDTLNLLKEEIDQVFDDDDDDDQLDDEFFHRSWTSMPDVDLDDEASDAVDPDDDAVQEELPVGDNSDDEPETPSTFNKETYDTMLVAYTKLEERKEELAACLESASESISGLLEDAETFRRGLDRNGWVQT